MSTVTTERTTTDLVSEVRRAAAEFDKRTRARDVARDRLRDAVVRLVRSGEMSEVQAAKLAGVNRNTVRTWLGKQDSHNRAIRHDD